MSTMPKPTGEPAAADTLPSVSEVMHTGVIEIPAQATLIEIAALMAERRIHCVVVNGLDAGPERLTDAAWGIVSDLDLMGAIAVEQDRAGAGTIAATDAPIIGPDDSVIRAAQLMTEHETAHLLVAAATGDYPLGIISSLDVAAALAGHARGE